MDRSEQMQEFMRRAQETITQSYAGSGVGILYDDINISEHFIEMSDGKKMRSTVYRPNTSEPLPLVLQRTCYPHNEGFMKIHATELARRGYAFMWQFCRGTGGSEGTWEPNVNDRSDGLDTLAWLEKQDWVDSIGYWGDSYLAFTGWVMADAVTPKVKSMCLGNYGTDRYVSAYEKRLFRHDVLTSWAMGNAGFEITADYIESCKYMPHEQVDTALWGKKLDWYREWITNTKIDDPYWQEGFWKDLRDIPSKFKVPVFISEGWFDHHLGSALKSWDKLPDKIKEHSWLEIGPQNHFGQNSIGSYEPKNPKRSNCPSPLEWFELTLKQKKLPEQTVNLYSIGEDTWLRTKNWPDPDTNTISIPLSGTGQDEAGFTFDPTNPVPSHGAESMLHSMDKIGSLLQPEPGFRDDVLTFLTGKLAENIQIFGKIKVKLNVSTDAEDTAFTAKLMEVLPDGKTYNIRSSITTIAAETDDYVPGDIVEVTIDMWDIVWTAKKGSKLRLDISSSDFPQYAVHSNYPGVWSRSETTKPAYQRIFFGTENPSSLVLDTRQAINLGNISFNLSV